jgi:hypothetical protein
MRESVSASPFLRAWQDTQIQEWLAPALERMDWNAFNETARANTGRTPAEVVEWLEGGVLLAVRNLDKVGQPGSVPPLVLLADFGSKADELAAFLQQAMSRWQERQQLREEQEEYAGVMVYTVISEQSETDEETDEEPGEDDEDEIDTAVPAKPDLPFVWAINDGVLIVAADKSEVFAILDAQLDGGARQPLESAPRFQRAHEAADPSDFVALVHLPPLVNLMQAGLEQALQANPNPFTPAPRDIVTALGLDALQDIVATSRTTPDETVVRYRLSYSAPRGLLGLLNVDTAAFPQPRWIPARWQNVATYRFDVGQFIPRLEAIVTTASPALGGMIQGMTAQMLEKTGVDLKRDLFGSFGDEVVVAQHFTPGESATGIAAAGLEDVPQLFAISLRDADTFERSFEKLLQNSSPGTAQLIKSREYLGYRLNTYTPALPPMPEGVTAPTPRPVHYAFGGGYAFIAMGSASPLEEAIQALAADGADTFWTRQDVRDVVARLPRNATSFQLQDTAALLGLLVDTFERSFTETVRSARMAADDEDGESEDEDEPLVVTNSEAKPTRELFSRYFGLTTSHTTMTDTEIEAVSVMSAAKK